MQVHRYAATKGSPERLDLSWWHFPCIMHLQSPNVAEEQEKEVHGDTLQKYTNPTTMKCKKKLLNQMCRFVMAESPPEIISPPFLQEKKLI